MVTPNRVGTPHWKVSWLAMVKRLNSWAAGFRLCSCGWILVTHYAQFTGLRSGFCSDFFWVACWFLTTAHKCPSIFVICVKLLVERINQKDAQAISSIIKRPFLTLIQCVDPARPNPFPSFDSTWLHPGVSTCLKVKVTASQRCLIFLDEDLQEQCFLHDLTIWALEVGTAGEDNGSLADAATLADPFKREAVTALHELPTCMALVRLIQCSHVMPAWCSMVFIKGVAVWRCLIGIWIDTKSQNSTTDSNCIIYAPDSPHCA